VTPSQQIVLSFRVVLWSNKKCPRAGGGTQQQSAASHSHSFQGCNYPGSCLLHLSYGCGPWHNVYK